jgi:purine-nucleoside phosphorylase
MRAKERAATGGLVDQLSDTMSTVAEAIVAAQIGMRVLGISTITNISSPDVPQIAGGEEVLAMAGSVSDRLFAIVRGVVAGFER